MIVTYLLAVISALFVQTRAPLVAPVATPVPSVRVLASKEYSLTDRYSNTFVNDVFADNILLTLSYMHGDVKKGEKVDWEKVHEQGEFQFTLKPGDTFAFHDQVLDQYKDSVVQTTNAHFDSTEGFKSDGWLVGDGVCHLASFLNVVSKAAGLAVDAPTRHDFAAIPDVSRADGTSIFYMPGEKGTSSRQNLYVTNTTDKTVAFVFSHSQERVDITVEQLL